MSPRFLFILIASLLATLAAARAQDVVNQSPDEAVIFSADEVFRDRPDGPITARGAIEAFYKGRRLTADELVFDPMTGVVTALGSVAVTDQNGVTAYAERVDLTTDFADGVIDGFAALLAENGRLAAARAVRRGARRNELDYAVYSACDVCKEDGSPKTPTWRVKALRVVQDVERKVIRYRHAVLEIKGVPVLYTPYFQMPDPSVERQSGFLTPSIGQNGRIGAFAEIPYYFALSSHYDATLFPKITADDGVLWQGEYRHRTRRGQIAIQGGVLDFDDQAPDAGEAPSTRWHYFAKGYYELPNEWRADLDLERVSDDTYLRRYDVERTGAVADDDGLPISNRLRSNLSISRKVGDGFADIDAILFEGIRESDDATLTPLAAPAVDIVQRFEAPFIGGDGRIQLNGVQLRRQDGADTTRFTGSASWKRSFIGLGGQKVVLTGDLRGDAYVQDDLDLGTEIGVQVPDESENVVTRIAPTAAIDWSYPFIRTGPGPRIVIEPRVQIVASAVNADEEDILNEDSQSIEFDATNLFVLNKSPGFDVFEDGERANVGVVVSADFGRNISASATIGQQFRLREANDFAAANGLDGRRSDIVSGLEVRVRQWVQANARVRFDEVTGRMERNDASLSTRIGPFSGTANYARINTSAGGAGGTRSFDEAITATAALEIYRGWRITGSTQNDIDAGEPVRHRLGVGYQDDCATFELVYQRDFVRDRDLEPATSILFTFSLNTLGR